MTIYAFAMTLVVGMFIGSYITIAVALHMETRHNKKLKKQMAVRPVQVHFAEHTH